MSNEKFDMYSPTITLDDFADSSINPALDKEEAARQESFTPEERKQVDELVKKIDLHNSDAALSYGVPAQKKLADFSDTILKTVRTKDMNEVGDMLSNLVADLKFEPTEKKGILGMAKKGANKVENIRAHYAKVSKNVESVSLELEKNRNILMKDAATLDQLFKRNKVYFKELNMYIAAGKIALHQALNEELPRLNARAVETGLPEDAQEAQDFAATCDRFDMKLNDLAVSRTICLQNAPQIRMVQNNDITMTDKINSALVTTIPLWKNQLVISLGLAHSEKATKVYSAVTNTTNDLLKANADMLQQTTTAVARESERNIVDIDTLRYTNEKLINTFDELVRIREEGREKRRTVEAELEKIENEMREKLIEMSGVR